MIRKRKLVQRSRNNAVWALVLIAVALGVGMAGYSYFGGLDFVRSFANAAMILSGMGPLDPMPNKAGEVFEGFYALISGFLFLAVVGFALAPAFHHILRNFHLEDEDDRKLH